MTTALSTRVQNTSWQDLGSLTNAAFRESDILYDSATSLYYLFSTGSYTTNAGKGQIDMYVAVSPAALTFATPVTNIAPGVYPTVFKDPADSKWHLYAERFDTGVNQHFIATATPVNAASFTLQAAAGLNFQLIDLSVRKYANATVATTGVGSATAGIPNTITPASMTNIAVGSILYAQNADTNGTNAEIIKVTTATATTFTANFTLAKSAGFTIGVPFFAVGIPSSGTQTPVLVWADGPHGKIPASHPGIWRPIVGDTTFSIPNYAVNTTTSTLFYNIGVPSWAAYATPDPNIAFTSDGRAWVFFTAKALVGDTPAAFTSGLVEIDLTTGYAIGTAIQLTDPHVPWGRPGVPLSDLVYVQAAGPNAVDFIFGVTNDGGAANANYSWGVMQLPMDGQPGEGYPNCLPVHVRTRVGCGAAGAFVDVSSTIDPYSFKLKRTASTGAVTAEWDTWAWTDLIGGVRYVIQDWQNVQIDDLDTGIALFMGYTMEPSDVVDGAEKRYHIVCQSVHVDLDKPTRQIVTQFPPFDGSPVVNTTSVTDVTAGSARTFVVPNRAHLYSSYTGPNGQAVGGRRVIAQNANGTNREVITVTNVTPSGLTATITADFRLSKTGSGTPWVLSGGLVDYDLVAGGFKAMNPSGTMVAYQGIVDEYFNYPSDGSTSLTVLKNAIGTSIYSLPHLKFSNTTPHKALQTIVEQNTLPNYRVTVSHTYAAGTSVVIVPDSTVGLNVGAFIYMANADGSNPERQMITVISGGNVTVDLQYSKTGTGPNPWIINTGAAPWYAMVWDNSFTRQLFYGDLYDFSLNTPIELTDASALSLTQSHYNIGYERRISGADRGSKITTVGDLGAVGTYEDTAITALLPRVVALEPVVKRELITNADCVVASQQTVAQFGKSKESILQLVTHQQISSTLFRSAHIVKWTGNLEGGTPAYYPIQDCELAYPQGIATYTFTLGDRLGELGDKAVPAYGAGSFRDLTAPQAPTWAAAGAWIISNVYDPATHRTTMQVEATLSGELDLFRAHFGYQLAGGQYNYSGPIPIVGGATSVRFTTPTLPPNTSINFIAWVVDSSSNVSQTSSVANTTTAATVVPVAPTMTGETVNRYNGLTNLTDVTETYTENAQPPGVVVDHYEATVTPLGGFTRFYTFAHQVFLTAVFDGLDPGVLCDAYMFAVDSTGVTSAASTLHQFTTDPAPPGNSLKNKDFAFGRFADATSPLNWARTNTGAGNSVLSAGVASLKGTSTLKQTASTGIGPVDSTLVLSDAVNCYEPTTITTTELMHVRASYYTATQGGTTYGTFTVTVRWYDAGNTQVGTGTVPSKGGTWSGHPTPNQKVILDTTVTPPANAVTCKLDIKLAGGTGNDNAGLYWGGLELEPAITPPAIGAGAFQNDMTLDATGTLLGGGVKMSQTGQSVLGDGTVAPANIFLIDHLGVTQGSIILTEAGAARSVDISATVSATPLNLRSKDLIYLGGVTGVEVDLGGQGLVIAASAAITSAILTVKSHVGTTIFQVNDDGTITGLSGQVMDYAAQVAFGD